MAPPQPCSSGDVLPIYAISGSSDGQDLQAGLKILAYLLLLVLPWSMVNGKTKHTHPWTKVDM